jgi:hypothetical protein
MWVDVDVVALGLLVVVVVAFPVVLESRFGALLD